MAIAILKNAPIHTVVSTGGSGAVTDTITLASLANSSQTVGTPKVDISALHVSVPSGTATITRNGGLLWTLTGSHTFPLDGFADNRENASDIVVAFSAGGTIILELVKLSGYGDSQHINPS